MTPLPVVLRIRVSTPDEQPPSPPRSATCAAPSCGLTARHRHHAVNRSITFGPADYVLIDEMLVRNVVDLCVDHHFLLEDRPGGHRSRLRFLDTAGWGWYDRAITTEEGHIYWLDSKSGATWKFRGFLKGDAEDWILPTAA